ncbi:MAG: amidase [Dehalococcoidia bacterium]
MADTALAFTPAYKLAQLIKNKELSPVELVDCFLERINTLNPKLNAFLTVTESEARATAMAAEKALVTQKELPPLHGVPVAIKDSEYTKGIRTTLGSLVYKDFVPDEDSILVERLKSAGAIMLGKSNLPEFAFSGSTFNHLRDPCCTPWNLERTSGGSSGGSATAIASGLSPLATGSDFGGSIRIPSGFCGVYGIKPTHGRIPLWPSLTDMPLCFDSGPITRTVRDAAIMLSIMAGHDRRDPMSLREKPPDFLKALDGPPTKLRIAWSPDLGFAKVDSEVRSVSEAAAHVFESLGCIVEEPGLTMDNPTDILLPLNYGDELAFRGHLLKDHLDDLTAFVRETLEEARKTTAAEYSDAIRGMFRLKGQMADFFEEYDILLTPTNAVPAFPLGAKSIEIEGQVFDPEWGAFPFTTLCNVTGQPAASLPCGFSSDGLPVGLQVIGRWGDEVTVLKACAAFEQARPWADKMPQIAQL